MLGRVESCAGTVGQPEDVACDEFKVRKTFVGLPQVQDARTRTMLLRVPQSDQRQAVRLPAAPPSSDKYVNLFG